MFQIVLFSVIAYLAACYGYGLFLLVKLVARRRFEALAGTSHGADLTAEGPLMHPAAGEGFERRAA